MKLTSIIYLLHVLYNIIHNINFNNLLRIINDYVVLNGIENSKTMRKIRNNIIYHNMTTYNSLQLY